jgi:hypothetical protein
MRYNRPYEKEFPFPPSDINYCLTRVEGPNAEHVAKTVPDPEARFRAHPLGEAWLREQEYLTSDPQDDCFKWEDPTGTASWRRIPAEILLQVFDYEECFRLFFDSIIMSELSDYIEEFEPLLWKMQNSQWRYGSTHDWNLLVDHMNAFKRLSINLPDFEIKVAHTYKFNPVGWSVQTVDDKFVYLDGAFGLLLYYKGKHVLTVGFSLSSAGVLISQIQLREKKGNRFLYGLPQHYVDVALDLMARAFGEESLCLVTGKTAALAVASAYKESHERPGDETLERVKTLYNRRLENFRRGPKAGQWYGREFVRLLPRRGVRKAAA